MCEEINRINNDLAFGMIRLQQETIKQQQELILHMLNSPPININSILTSIDLIKKIKYGNTAYKQQQEEDTTNEQIQDITELKAGISPAQLIKFGLTNMFGKVTTEKIMKMMESNKNYYIDNEVVLRNILLMAGCNETRVDSFIDWVKRYKHYTNL
jgi:hypothetical protein